MKVSLMEALPLLIGVCLGVLLQYLAAPVIARIVLGVVPILLGSVVYLFAIGMMKENPVSAVHVWQGQVLVPIGLMALATWGLAEILGWMAMVIENSSWFGIAEHCAEVEDDGKRAACIKGRVKEISTGLAGAITAFVGAMFMDDLQGQKGRWWPASQVKRAMGAAFAKDVLRRKEEMDAAHAATVANSDVTTKEAFRKVANKYERLKRAIHSVRMSNEEPTGWTYAGALARAEEIERQLGELKALRVSYPNPNEEG